MSSYDQWTPSMRRPTLNDLQAQRHSLNMRLLLAVQFRDSKTQEALEQELLAINKEIDSMGGGKREKRRTGEWA